MVDEPKNPSGTLSAPEPSRNWSGAPSDAEAVVQAAESAEGIVGSLDLRGETQPPRTHSRLRDAVLLLVDLHHVAMGISAAGSDRQMIRAAVLGAQSRLGVDRLAVFLRDGDYIQGTWGTDQDGVIVDESGFRSAIKSLPEHEMVERAFREQNYVAVRQGVALRNEHRVVGQGWNAMVALWAGDEAIGWIACDNLIHQRPLEPLQIEVLKLFAASLAQALVRGRAEERLLDVNRRLEERVAVRTADLNAANLALEAANSALKKLSRSDGLTGIANRRLFDEELAKEWARCARLQETVAVVLLDVDFFKQYNDAKGHVEGDAALVAVARALEGAVRRPADLAARYGGEEFVLLLPQTDLRGTREIVERARRAVAELAVPHPSSTVSEFLTLSAGVAVADPRTSAAEDLLRAADRALYSAKQLGRDRVVFEAALEEMPEPRA